MTELLQPTPEEIAQGEEMIKTWEKVSGEIKPEVKDHIGRLYIIHILGLDEETAKTFVDVAGKDRLDTEEEGRKYREAYDRIGRVQSGIPMKSEGLEKFWKAIHELAPQLVPTEKHTNLLVQYGSSWEASDLVSMLRLQNGEGGENFSFVLNDLIVNAHAYK